MTFFEPPAANAPSESREEVLGTLIEKLRVESEPYAFERLWDDALAAATTAEDRDNVLLLVASRLEDIAGLTGGSYSSDRLWLRHVANELGARGDRLSSELQSAAQKMMRAAIFEAEADLQRWRDALNTGTSITEFIRAAPRSVASLRDLARLVERLRRIDALKLVSAETVRELIGFHEALSSTAGPATFSVPEWMRIPRSRLLEWADDTANAPHQLPLLVRRLIRESGRNVTSLHFPSGSGVTTGGWDGVVHAEVESPYVPAGRSGWELSVDKDSLSKAEEDFEARVASVLPSDRRAMTFVELICRPWQKAEEFQAATRALGEFRDVRAYNVDDIEAWLEQCPATTIWFNELFGRSFPGIRTAGEAWLSWLRSTDPPLEAAVVLAGRNRTVSEVHAAARSGSGVTTVGGEARLDEIIAFFAAAWHTAEAQGDPSLAELLITSDEQSARQLFQTPGSLVILVTRPELARLLPPASGHRVFVAIPGSDKADVLLPPVDPDPITDYFKETGATYYVARDRAELARRSLLALRRHLALQPELHRPQWASSAASVLLRRTLLVNAWNGRRAADTSAVERLIGRPYAEVEEDLRQLAGSHDDPFVEVVDDRWHVVSANDSWSLIGSQLTAADLEAFGALAVEVLTDVDPVQAIPDDERWRASLDGIARSYSGHLRRGIARSVALLATSGAPTDIGGGRSGSNFAREVVWRTLKSANEDPSFAKWTALAPQLPMLAEAAPEEFTSALHEGLVSEPPFFGQVFQDAERGFLGPRSSPHTHLLWALETLAWSPDYFGDVYALLAELAKIDPGGGWSNRPVASLKSIVCPWHPNTTATVDQRFAAIDRLRTSAPDIAWEVMISMLPDGHGSQIVQRGPQFRTWKTSEPVVTHAEYRDVVRRVSERLLIDAGASVGRWTELIDHFDHLAWDTHESVRDRLAELATQLQNESDRREVWDRLRSFVARHRQFADANWSLPESVLATLDPLVEMFVPQDARQRHGWLFAGGRIELGDFRRRDNFEEYDAEVDRRRTSAIGEIYETGGLKAVIDFGSTAAYPGQVGLALARYSPTDEHDTALLVYLGAEPDSLSSVAFAFFGERFRQRGWHYIESALQQEPARNAPLVAARLLRSTWEPIEAANRADRLGSEVADAFWREFSYFGLGQEFEGVLDVAARLNSVGRHAAALDFLAMYARRRNDPDYAEAIATSLEGLMAEGGTDSEAVRLSEYEFEILLRVIAEYRDLVGRERAVRLEWFFLPALGFDPDAPNLHRTLSEDPAFFVQMVSLIYRPAHPNPDEPQEPTEALRRAADNAFRLLHSWHRAPGVNDQGEMNGAALRSWVAEARRLLAEADRVAVGDDEIGQSLVAAPADDYAWPCKDVRDLIEELQSENVDSGFRRRIFNNRGATSRSLDEGGRQEWALAESYRASAEKMRPTWSRLARIFEDLAAEYEGHARREDAAAERRRRGID